MEAQVVCVFFQNPRKEGETQLYNTRETTREDLIQLTNDRTIKRKQ